MYPKKQNYKNLAETVIKNLSKRNIEGFYCETKEEALKKALSYIKENDIVSYGGSETLEELNLIDTIENATTYTTLSKNKPKTREEKDKNYRQVFSSNVYFMSSNAITVQGEIINIDGYGNRVAALIYGPEKVIIVAGMNKISLNVEEAIKRVQNYATPPNAIRLNKQTPCAKTGHCHQCMTEDTLCCQMVITRRSMLENRIHVILVGEELGF